MQHDAKQHRERPQRVEVIPLPYAARRRGLHIAITGPSICFGAGHTIGLSIVQSFLGVVLLRSIIVYTGPWSISPHDQEAQSALLATRCAGPRAKC